jgi:hypothetical protein
MHDQMYPLPVAAEMRAGAAFAHSVIALEAIAEAAHR